MAKLIVEIVLDFDDDCSMDDINFAKSGLRTDLKESVFETINENPSCYGFKFNESIVESNGSGKTD